MRTVLDKHQISFWLEHGTLLGCVREGKIIDGDYDIDLATFSKQFLDKYEQISKGLYNLGYDIYITENKMTIKKKDKHATVYLYYDNKDKSDGVLTEHITRNRISKKNFKANILLYGFLEGFSTPYKDIIHNYTSKTKFIQLLKKFMMVMPSKKALYNLLLSFGEKIDCLVSYDINIPLSYVGKFKVITFYNMKINIPGKPEKYLEHMYGRNWRIPDRNWHPWKSFYKLMKEYNDKLAVIAIKKDLLLHLSMTVDMLNKHKIHFWMYGGALLGYVRNGDLIPWDKDIDLFVWKKDYLKVLSLKDEFKKAGFRYLIREKNIILAWDDKNIGIMHYELQGDYAIREKLVTKNKFGNMVYFGLLVKAVEYNKIKLYRFLRWLLLKFDGCYLAKQVVPSHFYLDLKEIDFFGIKVKVPAETEEYLEYTFGKDWKVPQKDFKYNPEYFRVVSRPFG